jgi:hypothetical protein
LVVVGGVARTKCDLLVGKGNASVVRDGDAMGVTAQILEHVLGATEGAFQIDHPGFSEKRGGVWLELTPEQYAKLRQPAAN